MKPKIAAKLAVDVLMTLALLFLMGYQFWGEAPHEWAGAGQFLLFIAHHILNGNWHKSLTKGRYGAARVLTLCLDSLVLVFMLVQLYSGIVMSRYVFVFLPLSGGLSLARRLHILGAYWGFLLIGLHVGLHWNMILGICRKAAGVKSGEKSRRLIAFIAGLAVAGYGIWVFFNRDFPTYLFLKSEFVFLDYGEPKIWFYTDYLALMGLCVLIAHYGAKLSQRMKKKTGKSQLAESGRRTGAL